MEVSSWLLSRKQSWAHVLPTEREQSGSGISSQGQASGEFVVVGGICRRK